MAEQIIAELQISKHLLKYVVRCLHPATQNSTKFGPDLARAIVEIAGFGAKLHDSVDPKTAKGSIALAIDRRNIPELDPHTHNKLVAVIREFFDREFVATVDDQMNLLIPQRTAIIFVRDQFGITDDDIDLRSSERFFQRVQHDRYQLALKNTTLGSTPPPPPKKGRPSRSRFMRMRK
jgi:hypothetical protein